MPYLKTEVIYADNETGDSTSHAIKINVNVVGEFYCVIPDELLAVVKARQSKAFRVRFNKKDYQAFSKSPQELIDNITSALKCFLRPEITETPIILYNLESHVMFAESPDGAIHPNAEAPDAMWLNGSDCGYGGHHMGNPSMGGYSLTIGARAYTKVVYSYGASKTVKFIRLTEGVANNESLDLLNSWCGFSLPDNAKEIPYSDEAAYFFHKLLLGMATLSRDIQRFANDDNLLQQMILADQDPLLSGPNQEK